MRIIIGTGVLAQAIHSNSDLYQSKLIKRETYTSWYKSRDTTVIENYFNSLESEKIEVYLCFGATNSKISKEEMLLANYELPLFILNSVQKFANKIITFGTIQELLNTDLNNYTKSKHEFSKKIQTENWLDGKLLHVRLHTVYGSRSLKQETFIGQIVEHISNSSKFKMSSGQQIREYHHINDIAQILEKILEMKLEGPVDISSGQPLKLGTLANYIFEQLNLRNLLLINENDRVLGENYDKVFEPNHVIKTYKFIEPLNGVFEYVKQQLGHKL